MVVRTKSAKKDWVGLGVSAFMSDEAAHSLNRFTGWANEVKDAVKAANDEIMYVAQTYKNNNVDSLGGFYAEAFHSGSFNRNAAINQSPYHTSVPHSHAGASPDINTNWGKEISSKYNKTAQDSLNHQAETFQGPGFTDSKYIGQERLIPSDQLNEAHKEALRKIAKETSNRPDVAERFRETNGQLTDRIKSPDGIESQPLTKDGANEWARNTKQGKIETFSNPDSVSVMSHMKEIGEAAGTAALISVAIQSAPVIIVGVKKLFQEPDYSIKAFGRDISEWAVNDGLKVGTDAFVKAALSGSICAAIKSGALQGPFSNMTPTAVAGISVAGVETAKALWKWQKGEINGEQAASESMKAGLRTCASLAGKAVGQALIPIPVVGAIVGSFVAAFVLEKGFNSIENSRSIQMLRIIDETFYIQRDVLRGIFDINANYRSLVIKYEDMLNSNYRIIGDKELHIDRIKAMAENNFSIDMRNNDIVEHLKKRQQVMSNVKQINFEEKY